MTTKSKVPQIRFKGFSEVWDEKTISNLGDIVTGSTPNTQDKSNYDGKYLFVSPADIQDNRYVKNTITKLSEKGHIKGRILKENSILFVSIGSTIGKVGQILEKSTTNQQINGIIPNKENNSNFIYSLLLNKSQEIKKLASSQAVPIINKTNFSEIQVILTEDLDEQVKIGNYFQQVDKLIEQKEKKYQKLKQFKKAMLDKIFPKNGADTPEIRFKGFSGKWEEKKLGEICKLITKGTTPLDRLSIGTINYIKVENINSSSGAINITTKITQEEHRNYLKRSQLQENDILFSIAGTLGRVTTINKKLLPANTNQALAIIRLDQGVINYITTYLKSNAVNSYIKQNPTVGAQPNLSLAQIENIELILPKEEEQTKIGNYFQKLDKQIDLQLKELEKLKNIKKASLDKMFV